MSLASKSFALASKTASKLARLVPDDDPDPLRVATGEVGRPVDRVDGPDKVTGALRYTGEASRDGVAHAVIVGSTIAKGRVLAIDGAAALASPGVLLVMTHENAPKRRRTATFATLAGPLSASGTSVPFLNTDRIEWNGQPVAVVVADTFENARHGAALVEVAYEEEPARVELAQARGDAFTPSNAGFDEAETRIGDADAALARAAVRIDATYTTPYVNHCAMEPHATVAEWQGDRLLVHDTTQYPIGLRDMLAKKFGLPKDKVVVTAPFIGGGFGGKAAAWPNVDLAVSAAKLLGRPVKLVLSRPDTFRMTGGRSMTEQRVALGADRTGRLQALMHEGLGMCTRDVFAEYVISPSRHGYAAPAIRLGIKVTRLDRIQNSFMRAPGDAPGSFALESAMDELADACGIDPVEFLILNQPERDPTKGTEFTSRHLIQCLREGAAAFGWERRTPEPRSMRDGRALVGYGVAAASYPTQQFTATVGLTLTAAGEVVIETATSEMGTGTATTQAQAAAERLGVPPARVRFVHGASSLPTATTPGGSATTITVGAAIRDAQEKLLKQLLRSVAKTGSPLAGATPDECDMRDGGVFLRNRPGVGETYEAILARAGRRELRVEGSSGMSVRGTKYSAHAYAAHFCEVHIDPDTGEVRVKRWTSVVDGGRIISPKLARSQIVGGVIMGLGMALMEETVTDARTGGVINHDLAEYHLPVHADVPAFDVRFLDQPDPRTPLGAKGIGELGTVGSAAAIANAVHHATGVRVRDLPIRLEKLL